MQFKPHGIAEANITAELYQVLKQAGFKAYLEYTFERCRFDCIIHDDKNVLAIIEVKRFKPKPLSTIKANHANQIDKYSKFNLPVYFVNAVNQFPKLINKLKDLNNHSNA